MDDETRNGSATACDLRAAIARRGVAKYLVATAAGVHPSRLGSFLSGRLPLSPAMAARIAKAIEQLEPRERERR